MSRQEENVDGNVVSTDAQVSNDDNVETTAAGDEAAVGDGKWSLCSLKFTGKILFKAHYLTTMNCRISIPVPIFISRALIVSARSLRFSSRQQGFGNAGEGLLSGCEVTQISDLSDLFEQ